MVKSDPLIDKVEAQRFEMIDTLISWANINSWSENPKGLASMAATLKKAFRRLGRMSEIFLSPREVMNPLGEIITIPTGKALLLNKRPKAKTRLFLGGHMDTVFPPTGNFLKAEKIDKERLRGPGVADMKGGLLVMLKALEILEQSPYAKNLGWQVLINPDEEVGSPCSQQLIYEGGQRSHLGLLFEPAFPDGSLVSARKGSANFTIEAFGKKAHAGRDFYAGRNAIVALAKILEDIKELTDPEQNITVNIGRIGGGGPINIVPDFAFCQFNVRALHSEDMDFVKEALEQIIEMGNDTSEVKFKLREDICRPPKPFCGKTQELFEVVRSCGKDLGLDLHWKESGGVCDGNIVAQAGIPTLDTLGVVGGNLHTDEEYMLIDSLVERTKLTAHILIQFAKEMQK